MTLTRFSVLVVLLVAAASCIMSPVEARKKDRNQPHPHKGILSPYKPGPFPNLRISAKEQAKLLKGESVMKQTPTDPNNPAGGGRAICIQDIDAPKAAVWNQILDLESYTKKVAKVVKCQNYSVTNNKNHPNIKTRMVLGVLPGYSYESYYDHTFHPKQDSMTWTLDYQKTSDFNDVSGHWHVEEAPAGKTRVFYACDIKLTGAVPGPILNYISKAALKQATSWVKKESEANPTETKMAAKYHYNVQHSLHLQQQHAAQGELALSGSGRGGGGRAFMQRGMALFHRKQ